MDINNSNLLIQWGIQAPVGSYTLVTVTYPIAFTIPPTYLGSGILWGSESGWYVGTNYSTLQGVVDVAGTPCDVFTTDFKVMGWSYHRWFAIGW